MLQMNLLQSDSTRDPISGSRKSDQAAGNGIDGLINFAATIIATTPTPAHASPMLAEPASIPCSG